MRLPKEAQLWLPGYVQSRWRALRDRRDPETTVDILFCVADHYEPDWGRADPQTQSRRVARWVTDYPLVARGFTDSDGYPPQHTFFSPQEAYQRDHLDGLVDLCRQGYGEIEVHLHHSHDTSANLRARLDRFTQVLASRHGALARDARGQPAYGFIHGNWALDNGRLDDRFCGVNDELTVLRETGCYADFTMPAAPDRAQSRIVNTIYYAIDDPDRPRSYDSGVPVCRGQAPPPNGLMLIPGPLTLRRTERIYGVLPRIDNGAIDHARLNRPSIDRFQTWVDAAVSVAKRPEWVFVKVHTHGAKEANADVLLGEPMLRFHEALVEQFNDGRRFRLHYVTAREMFNIIKAAEQGESGNAGRFRDYVLTGNPLWRHRLADRGAPVARGARGVAL